MRRVDQSRQVFAAAVLCLCAFVVAGCSPEQPATTPSASTSPVAPTQGTTGPDAPEGGGSDGLSPVPNDEEDVAAQAPSEITNPTPMSETGTFGCDGQDLNLIASDATITLEGYCGSVIVSGSNVILNAESTLQTKIVGDNVTFNGDLVGWLIIDGSKAKVDLATGYLHGIQLNGSNNAVKYGTAGVERVVDNGKSNTVTKR